MMCFSRSAAVVLLVALSLAADAAPQQTQVTLDKRKDNKAYGTSAYSFRKATSDQKIHRNYVDVVFNGTGSLHINPVNGEENQICDLGTVSLKDSPDDAPADAKWFKVCVKPEAGHVYLEQIKQNGQTMTVKFSVDEASGEKVKITWVTIKALEGEEDTHRGAAGTMGNSTREQENH